MVQIKEALQDRSFESTAPFRAVPVSHGAREAITPFPTIHPVEESPVEQQEITVYEKDKVVLLPEGYRRVPGNYTWEAFSHLVLTEGPVTDDELYDNLQALKDKEHLPGTPSVEKTMRFLRSALDDEHGALLQRVIIDGSSGYHLNAKINFAEPDTTPPLPANDIVGAKIPTSYDIFLANQQQTTANEEKSLPQPRPETQKERDTRLVENLWPELASPPSGDGPAANDLQENTSSDEETPSQPSESDPSWKEVFLADIADIKLLPLERSALEAFMGILEGKDETEFIGGDEWEAAAFHGKSYSRTYRNTLRRNINLKIGDVGWQIKNFAKGKQLAQLRLIKQPLLAK